MLNSLIRNISKHLILMKRAEIGNILKIKYKGILQEANELKLISFHVFRFLDEISLSLCIALEICGRF